jgi:hypothetical protein
VQDSAETSVFRPQKCPVGVDLTETKIFDSPRAAYNKEEAAGVGSYSYMLFNDVLCDEFIKKSRGKMLWQKILGTSVLPGSKSILTRYLLRNPAIRVLFWKLYKGPSMVRDFFEIAQKARGVERLLECRYTSVR